jgi:mutator protein MutT
MSLSTQVLTLCIIRENDKILLAMKKRGFGTGKWNGYGGKIENNETIEEALVREVKEESTIDLIEYQKRGEMKFVFPDIIRHVYVYEGTVYRGTAQETEEMQPSWFTIDALPFHRMWISDTGWFPYFLKRKQFTGEGKFDSNHNLLSLDVKEV